MMNKVSMKAAAVVIAMGFMAAPMTTRAADMASWQRSSRISAAPLDAL